MMREDDKGRILGRYRLLEEIGRGGMAVVFRAIDTSLKREVAVKLLHPHLVTHKEARERFEREAHAVARLHNSSIVEVYDYSETENQEVFIVMELIAGTTLRRFLEQRKGRPLLAEAAALMARKVFSALHAAHEEGIVHRDVKPENILISEDGEVKLSDFGIAYLAGIGQMTVTGQILGSPTYMSPEHIERSTVDARADIFSVGILLYEMAVGSLPFQGNNPHQIIKRVVEGYYDQPLSVNPSVGHGVASVIVRCLQQEPERRYDSAADAVGELDRILNQMGISSPDEALISFLADPDDWEASNRRIVIPRTLQLGNNARKQHQLPEAMNHFNRVLAMEPGNEAALDAVNGLSRRRQLRRGMERIGVVALIVSVIVLLSWLVLRDWSDASADVTPGITKDDPNLIETKPVDTETDVPSKPAPEEVSDGPANPKNIVIIEKHVDSDTIDQSITPGADTTQSPEPRPRPRIPPKDRESEEIRRTVIFNPQPMRVDVRIDGEERFVYTTTNRSRELAPGPHTVEFIPADPRLETATREFTVRKGTGPLTIGARLQWKPARLLVRSNVPTVVTVAGRSSGKTNTPLRVPLHKGPEETVKVLIGANDYIPVSEQVVIRSGETSEIVVHLEKEQQ